MIPFVYCGVRSLDDCLGEPNRFNAEFDSRRCSYKAGNEAIDGDGEADERRGKFEWGEFD